MDKDFLEELELGLDDFLMEYMPPQDIIRNKRNIIVTGEERLSWLQKTLNEEKGNYDKLLNASLDEQEKVYRSHKNDDGFKLYLVNPKEISRIWYTYEPVKTILIISSFEEYGVAEPWLKDYTKEILQIN